MKYLSMLCVDKLVGMDTLNSAIENLITLSNKEDWPSVNMKVANATVTIISEKMKMKLWVGC